jgi:hypothetical protein
MPDAADIEQPAKASRESLIEGIRTVAIADSTISRELHRGRNLEQLSAGHQPRLVAWTQAANRPCRRLLTTLGMAEVDRFVKYDRQQVLYALSR